MKHTHTHEILTQVFGSPSPANKHQNLPTVPQQLRITTNAFTYIQPHSQNKRSQDSSSQVIFLTAQVMGYILNKKCCFEYDLLKHHSHPTTDKLNVIRIIIVVGHHVYGP